MKWVVLAVRSLLGLLFAFGGIAFLFNLVTAPEQPRTGSPAELFMDAMMPTGYMHAVKVIETVGGVLLLIGRWPLVGLTLITPVAVNILFFEVFILKAPGLGIVLLAACAFLVWAYRSSFVGVFEQRPKIG